MAHLFVLVVDIVDVAGTVPAAIGPCLFDLDIVASRDLDIVVESLADTDSEGIGIVADTVVGTAVVPGFHNFVDSHIVHKRRPAGGAELHAVAEDALNFPDRSLRHWQRHMDCTALWLFELVV